MACLFVVACGGAREDCCDWGVALAVSWEIERGRSTLRGWRWSSDGGGCFSERLGGKDPKFENSDW